MRLHPKDAITIEQRLIGRVAASNRARVSQRRSCGGFRASDLERNDRDAPSGRFCERLTEPIGIARGLDEDTDDTHFRPVHRVTDVVGHGGREFLSG